MDMNGLKRDHRNCLNVCRLTASSHTRHIAVVEESLRSQITPQIARIDALQDRIANLKSEIHCMQERCGSKNFMAQILESLKDMQGEAHR
jgi:TolA-binding protein